MRVFLDANILFSGTWKDSPNVALLFDLADAGYCQLTTSRLAVEEARRNIARKRPERQPALELLVQRTQIGTEPSQSHLDAAQQHGLPD